MATNPQPSRHPEFGYSTLSGRYLTALHLEHLADAAEGTYNPDLFARNGQIVDRELKQDALVTATGEITPAGRWHLADKGWV